MSREPVRLLELGDLSLSERASLEAGRERVPVVYDVEAGAARFRASLAALAAAGAVATVHGSAGGSAAVGGKALLTSLAAKVLLGVAAGTALFAGGVVMGTRMAPRPAVAPATGPVTLVVPPAVTATPAATPRGAIGGAAQAIPTASAASTASTTRIEAANTGAPPIAEESLAASSGGHRAPPDRLERGPRAGAPSAGVVPAAVRAAESAESTRAAAPAVPALAPVAAASVPVAAPPATAPGPVAAAPATASVAAAEAPSQPPAWSDSLSELRALAVARNLVDQDPGAALTALDRMRQDHPRGYFVEERQALTVLALSAAGHTSTARQQAASFLRVFPNGPFSERVRAVLRPSN